MLNRSIMTIAACLLLANSNYALAATPEQKAIGWAERVLVLPENLVLEAKLASSVGTSALHASKIEDFKRDGKKYVRFEIEDRKGKVIQLERELLNKKNTITSGGNTRARRVVKIGVCVGNIYFEPEVLLADRSGLDQEIRIGRDVLSGYFLINPARTHTSTPQCSKRNS